MLYYYANNIKFQVNVGLKNLTKNCLSVFKVNNWNNPGVSKVCWKPFHPTLHVYLKPLRPSTHHSTPSRYPVPQSGGSISIILIGMHILVPFRCQIHYSFILSACASLELYTMEIVSCKGSFTSIRTAFRILQAPFK